MNFTNWVERNRNNFGSDYEILFASQVLPLVDGLQCDSVTAQHPFFDNDGKDRYCDFTIIESHAVRVAIEIDGYDKRGTGTGMSYGDFLDWQRRQASLASQGWYVLRFANRDVRDEPHRCAEHISRLLIRLRQENIGRVEIVTIQPKPHEVIVTSPKIEDARSPGILTKKNYKLIPVLVVCLLIVVALWQKNSDEPMGRTVHLTATEQSIPDESLHARYVSADVTPANASPTRALNLTKIIVPVAPVHDDSEIEEPSYGTLDCKNPLDWSTAKKHIGQIVTVIGPLLASKPRPEVTGSPMWLDVGEIYPNQNRLTVVVWGKNWSKFKARELDAEYWFETVFDEMGYASICITGKIIEYKGAPQIELQDPSQLWIGFHPNYR
jgi:hypothetical protein